MVLVDYGSLQVIGFVMGYNMYCNYWDISVYLFDDCVVGCDFGFGFWQDIFMQVQGLVLVDFSCNFSEVWDFEMLWYKCWFLMLLLIVECDVLLLLKIVMFVSNSVVQICWIQLQDDECLILEYYFKVLGNVIDYVYMENQYFCYVGFVECLWKIVQVCKVWGVFGDLYLFVVINIFDFSDVLKIIYDMMKGLGQE